MEKHFVENSKRFVFFVQYAKKEIKTNFFV